MALWSQEIFTTAWNFASLAHKTQSVPGTDVPYLNHIGNVTQEVLAAIAKASVEKPDLAVQCALLHDCIEDTTVTYDDLLSRFGNEVADGVLALSKKPKLPTKAEQMEDSLLRISAMPREVWMVKMADRISNLQKPPHFWDADKIKSYAKEAETILRALSKAHGPLSNRLRTKIDEYRRLYVEPTVEMSHE